MRREEVRGRKERKANARRVQSCREPLQEPVIRGVHDCDARNPPAAQVLGNVAGFRELRAFHYLDVMPTPDKVCCIALHGRAMEHQLLRVESILLPQ